jgi:ribulose-phosphate 3-epimerase
MIIPTILEKDFKEVKRKISLVDGDAELIQIDVADGVLVGGTTFLDPKRLGELHTKSNLEIHLMVSNPLNYVKKMESVVSMCLQVEVGEKILKEFIVNTKKLNYRVGISVNPETEIKDFEKYVDEVDFVQFMMIVPGAQGRERILSVFDKMKKFMTKYPKTMVQVDGGIKKTNILDLLQRGINNVVIGSEIFGSKDPRQKLMELQKMLPVKKDHINSLSDVKKIQKIAILGGANWEEGDETYKQAFEVSKILAENGYELINGGGPGVMKAATEGAHAGNQRVIVVTYHPNKPKRHYEGVSKENNFDEEIITLDYFDRTKVMLQNTDVHIVFKGSIGTLSELGMTWVSSWIHEPNNKPIILYGSFWNEILDVIEKNLVIKMGEREILKTCTAPEEVLEYIKSLEKS